MAESEMTFQEAMNQFVDNFAQRGRQLGSLQREMSAVSGSATSERRMLTVTVGARGELTGLTFNSREYEQLGPRELARVILETAAKARQDAHAKLAEKLGPAFSGAGLPAGVNLADLMAGKVDPAAVMPMALSELDILRKLPGAAGEASPPTPKTAKTDRRRRH
jgi:DNA-binding protein YbaB